MTQKRRERGERGTASPVPIARVVRIGSERRRDDRSAIRIEIGRARVDVCAGVDTVTLATVVSVLDARLTETEGQP